MKVVVAARVQFVIPLPARLPTVSVDKVVHEPCRAVSFAGARNFL